MTDTQSPESTIQFKPSTKKERIAELDALRGFALLGILLMNIEYFTHPLQEMFLGAGPVYSGIDLVADRFTAIFVQGKFWVMFAMLFGMGFSVIQSRMQNSGRSFGRFYLKRMFVLLFIGALHSIFIWSGDILFAYAFTGMVLLLFRKTKTSRLWKYCLLVFILMLLVNMLGGVADPDAPPDETILFFQAQLENANRLYPTAGFLEITEFRLVDFGVNAITIAITFPFYLCAFLSGVWLFKKGVFVNLQEHKSILKKNLLLGFPIGLAMAIPAAVITENSNMLVADSALENFMSTLAILASFILCMAYVSGFLLLAMQNKFNIRKVLAPVGRMALSNYLMQSLVFTFLFYGYGFGLWGSVSRAGLIPLALTFFVVQCIVSNWWMKSYKYGPLEWVWRRLSYGKVL